MDIKQLDSYASLLFDTGKRNNLISFKNTVLGSVEIIVPDTISVFKLAQRAATLEVFNSQDDSEEEIFEIVTDTETAPPTLSGSDEEIYRSVKISKKDFADLYKGRLKRNQVLLYNSHNKPMEALRNIAKKGRSAIEESGVNLLHLAIGFIGWTESESSNYIMKAPLLLVPISIENPSPMLPVKIKIIDDEIIVNPAFAHKMHTERGIDLPEFDEEMDIEGYLECVRELTDKLHWSLEYECRMGLFSFQKINMYRDIKENGEKILSSVGMKRMLGEPVEKSDTNLDIGGESEEKNPEHPELHSVVDADSSQSDAIEMAKSGKSFVLQGPPGTGKSQTITNIIAELIGDGKRVLFVSEKLAALNVVFEKLKRAGLEDFCLELHSHKANKREVINELCRTLRLPKSTLKESAERELCAKRQNEESLDGYARELHLVREGINKSLYSLYDEFSRYRHAPIIDFVIFDIKNKGEDYLKDAALVLERYSEYTETVGYNYKNNPWYGFMPRDLSYEKSVKIRDSLIALSTFADELISLRGRCKSVIAVAPKSIDESRALARLSALLSDSEFITPPMLGIFKKKRILETAYRMRELSECINSSLAKIDTEYDEDIYKLCGKDMYKLLSKSYSGVISRIFSSEYRKIIKSLCLSRKDGKKIKYDEALRITRFLSTLQSCEEELSALEKESEGLLGEGYRGKDTDFDRMIADIGSLLEIREIISDLGTLADTNEKTLSDNAPVYGELAREYSVVFSGAEGALSDIISDFIKEEYNPMDAELEELSHKFKACLEIIDSLENWCGFMRLFTELSELQLRRFIDAAIKENIPSEKILDSFLYAYYRQWIDTVIRETPEIGGLSRIVHDQAVKSFKEKDELAFSINKAKIKALVSERRPSVDMVAAGSEISLLLREGEKKRKIKSVRRILGETTELVQKIKPCFLMSPLSVSTFLSADFEFDAVIFDEASQIFPEDAIGAIYRAKQLIVVGDSKQMPPSNFFNAVSESLDEEESDEDIKDFESILDLSSASLPQLRLKWHYRSKSEELIAFSNKNFYSGELVTFPQASGAREGTGIDFHFANGMFDRTSKTNRIEAEAVVDLVFEHIRTTPERSLGVIAFSISQQSLIERLINKRRREDSSFESYFTADTREPFFVKNLETVQGDERDTIIFSIAYGRDSGGRLLMNFGPLNRAGGERRLNVAVTRAKHNIKIVSSMHGNDIDLSRTGSVGARLLREYLNYAENGRAVLDASLSVNTSEKFDSEFEMEVYDFLRENGYSADTQVGCSSFRIDIALKRPESSDYLLAIECDGASYHSAKNARDRDRLRQTILESMGWKFYRIWSTDWFRNKRVEKERLLMAAKDAVEKAGFESRLKSTEMSDIKDFEVAISSDLILPSDEETSADSQSFEEETTDKGFEFPKYRAVKVEYIQASCAYDPIQVILKILEIESPVSEEWMLKRTVKLFGRDRVSAFVTEQFESGMRRAKRLGIERRGGFLYLKDREIPILRVPSQNPDTKRDIKYIAPEELANGLMEILRQNGTAEKTSLYKILLKQCGVSRMTEAIQKHLDSALLLLKNEIIVSGNIISIKNH